MTAKQKSDGGWSRPDWVGAIVSILAISALCFGIYLLSSDARKQIDELATASADARQWTLAQVEVDFLKFERALLQENAKDEPNIEYIKRRFDIFYSRLSLLTSADVLTALREDQSLQISVRRLLDFRDETAELMDGPEAGLTAGLENILTDLKRLTSEARKVSLSGVKVYSALAEAQRLQVASAMTRLAVLTLLLVGLLTGVIVALTRLFSSARRQTRENIQSQRRLKATIEASLDAIVVANEDGDIVDLNAAAEDVFGHSNADMMGRSLAETIVPEQHRAAHNAGMKRHKATGEKRVVGKGRLALEALHASGKVIPVELSISAAKTDDGEVFVSYIRDISERLAQEDALREARDHAVAGEKAKADMMAIMSHEMRTPLNGIMGTLELLENTTLDEGQSKFLDVIGKSSKVLLEHVNDVLSISRLDSGAETPDMAAHDAAQICLEVIESLESIAEQSGNMLVFTNSSQKEHWFYTDRSKLRRVLTNLVGNAIKFTKAGRIDLDVGLSSDGSEILFSVSDTGVGIPQDAQERIFDEFVTLDPSYSRTNEGTGLGLSIVKRLVKDFGGRIDVESEVGKGSKFTAILPHSPAEPTPKSEPAIATVLSVPKAKRRLLLVEDDETNRLVAEGLLLKLGHEVVEAVDGRQGVKIASETKFDLILMDISMPLLDGVDAAEVIRTGGGPNAETPIAALTAHALPEDVERFKSAGMIDVLIKPISTAQLTGLFGRLDERGGTPQVVQTEQLLVSTAVREDLLETVGAEKAAELTQGFVTQVDDFFDSFEHEGGVGKVADLPVQLHNLIGGAAIFGANGFKSEIETAAKHLKDEDDASLKQSLKRAKEVWQRTREALKD